MYNQFTQNYLLTAADCDVVDMAELLQRLLGFEFKRTCKKSFFNNSVCLAMLLLKVKKKSLWTLWIKRKVQEENSKERKRLEYKLLCEWTYERKSCKKRIKRKCAPSECVCVSGFNNGNNIFFQFNTLQKLR